MTLYSLGSSFIMSTGSDQADGHPLVFHVQRVRMRNTPVLGNRQAATFSVDLAQKAGHLLLRLFG